MRVKCSEVLFWKRTDAETLKRYVSLRAVGLEIVCLLVRLGRSDEPWSQPHQGHSLVKIIWRLCSDPDPTVDLLRFVEGLLAMARASAVLPDHVARDA